MTVADLCLLAALLVAIAPIASIRLLGRAEFDNANPRDPRFYTPGLRSRAQAAHLNGYEALPFFAAAVILAEMRAMPQGRIDALAVAFVLARIVYVLCYLGDKASLRSLVFAGAFAINLAIFFLPAFTSH